MAQPTSRLQRWLALGLVGACVPAPRAPATAQPTATATTSAVRAPPAPAPSTGASTRAATPAPEEQAETCPPPAVQEEAHEAASLYRGFVELYGFLLFAAGKPEPGRLPSPERARDAVCAFFRDDPLALEPTKPRPAAPATCFDGRRTVFRSRDPQLDGDFHVLGLGSSTFAVLYQPPDRTTLTPPYAYELSKQGRFVISKMQQDAYWCSTSPTCYRGLPDDENAPGYYCYDNSNEQCVRRGFNTRVFVLDTLTERTIRFGGYDWQTDPQVVASEHELKVTTDRCNQAWPL